MKINGLKELALREVYRLVEESSSDLVTESTNKERGTIIKQGNPLFDASSKLSDAQRWLRAMLEEKE